MMLIALRRNFLSAFKSVTNHRRCIQLSSTFTPNRSSESCLYPISNTILPPNINNLPTRCLSTNNSNHNVPTDSVGIQKLKEFGKHILPYGKLIRIDRPIGSWLLFWPCGWSIALSAAPGAWPDPVMLGLFAAGAFIMRGAGCTINDMWDKNIDNKVERTKNRPLACGELTQLDALVFLSAQLGIGLLVLLQLNWYSIILGASSLGKFYRFVFTLEFVETTGLFIFRISCGLSTYETYNVLATTGTWNGL